MKSIGCARNGTIIGLQVVVIAALVIVLHPRIGAANPGDVAEHRGAANGEIHERAPASWRSIAASTHAGLFVPGTQPGSLVDDLDSPEACAGCHSGYSDFTGQEESSETWRAWSGSLMAQAARDPVFLAALDVANADVPGVGEYCLRCRLAGRSSVPDGSALTAEDREGITCALCHRMVDPAGGPGAPVRDISVIGALTATVKHPGSAGMVVDTEDWRRGPRVPGEGWPEGFESHLDAAGTVHSPFHEQSALCGTCHDIDNPLLVWDDASGEYRLLKEGELAPDAQRFPIERTYSEWRLSDFNRPEGALVPKLGRVSTCQDCHMAKFPGASGMYFGEALAREDVRAHDLSGAAPWVLRALGEHPDLVGDLDRLAALSAGEARSREMLQRAAILDVLRTRGELVIRITNQTGHKLPTGYVEGRRMWLHVEAFDAEGRRVFDSGRVDAPEYDFADPLDPLLRTWHAEHGLSPTFAAEHDLTAGPSFHFALNNTLEHDDRIPPRGYSFEAFREAGAAPYSDGMPDSARYADGQFWDEARYPVPDSAVHGTVSLLHQAATPEYIAFLSEYGSRGTELNRLWETYEGGRPELMAEAAFGLAERGLALPWASTGRALDGASDDQRRSPSYAKRAINSPSGPLSIAVSPSLFQRGRSRPQ